MGDMLRCERRGEEERRGCGNGWMDMMASGVAAGDLI